MLHQSHRLEISGAGCWLFNCGDGLKPSTRVSPSYFVMMFQVNIVPLSGESRSFEVQQSSKVGDLRLRFAQGDFFFFPTIFIYFPIDKSTRWVIKKGIEYVPMF